MNSICLHGLWLQLRGTLKRQWGMISGNSLAVRAGSRDLRDGRIEEREGIAKRETERQLADFVHRNRNWWDPSRPQ